MKLKHLCSVDKDLRASMLNSFWRVISGPLLLLAIPYFLTPIEQGYWYTFTGLAALSIFADLGFTGIVLQFTAHEFAYLKFKGERILVGDACHLWRLASFFRFIIKWLIKVVLIVFPLIMIGGSYFIAGRHDDIYWRAAWYLYSSASAVAFCDSVFLSFFEGCNSVSLLQSIRFRISVCMTCINIILLAAGFNLFALAIAQSVNAVLGAVYIYYYFRSTIKQLWAVSKESCYDWWPEFSSLIWRYAISWSSGYFIFQLFTPLAFYFHGAVFSGKVGIGIAMWTAGAGIASTWITAILPKMNMLISREKWNELDQIFHKNFMRAMLTMISGGAFYFLLYFMLSNKILFFQRVLDPINMGILYISWIFQTCINSLAAYLRAHKKEPLMLLSAFGGVWVGITTLFCAKFLPEEYMFLGFMSQYLTMPLVIRLYKNQKKEHFAISRIHDY